MTLYRELTITSKVQECCGQEFAAKLGEFDYSLAYCPNKHLMFIICKTKFFVTKLIIKNISIKENGRLFQFMVFRTKSSQCFSDVF